MRGLVQRVIIVAAFVATLRGLEVNAVAETMSGGPTVSQRIVLDEILLGTAFTVEFTANYPESMRFEWPSNFVLPPMLEILEHHNESSTDKGRKKTQLHLKLVALDTGKMSFPSQEFLFVSGELGGEGEGKTLFSDTLAFEVQALVAPGEQTIRPLLAPRALWVHNKLWQWKLAGAALLIVALLFWVVRNPRLKKSPNLGRSVPITLSPEEEAYAAFQVLEESGDISRSPGADVYLRMSEILRRYLGRRFGIPALDLTSSEIRSRLSNVETSHLWIRSLEEWLGKSDLVKFAGQSVSEEEARLSLQAARILVDRSKEVSHERPREIARA